MTYNVFSGRLTPTQSINPVFKYRETWLKEIGKIVHTVRPRK